MRDEHSVYSIYTKKWMDHKFEVNASKSGAITSYDPLPSSLYPIRNIHSTDILFHVLPSSMQQRRKSAGVIWLTTTSGCWQWLLQ
jgi:hypothetical protein